MLVHTSDVNDLQCIDQSSITSMPQKAKTCYRQCTFWNEQWTDDAGISTFTCECKVYHITVDTIYYDAYSLGLCYKLWYRTVFCFKTIIIIRWNILLLGVLSSTGQCNILKTFLINMEMFASMCGLSLSDRLTSSQSSQ